MKHGKLAGGDRCAKKTFLSPVLINITYVCITICHSTTIATTTIIIKIANFYAYLFFVAALSGRADQHALGERRMQ